MTFVLLGQCIMVSFTIKTFGTNKTKQVVEEEPGLMDTVSAIPGIIAEYSNENKVELIGLSVSLAVGVAALTMSAMNFVQLNPGKAAAVSLPSA